MRYIGQPPLQAKRIGHLIHLVGDSSTPTQELCFPRVKAVIRDLIRRALAIVTISSGTQTIATLGSVGSIDL